MNIEIDQLRVLQAVAREQSFTRAADKLHRTQPGVSQTIRQLEEALGTPLFERRGRTSTLTQAGQILLEHARTTFDALDQAVLRIEGLRQLQGGTLVVSTSDTTAYYILPAVLKEFRYRYPGVELRILSKPSPVSAQQVMAREADLGIVTLPVQLPGLVSVPLMIREDVVICHPEHALAGGGALTFDQLAHYPLVLLDHGSNTRSFIDQRFKEAGITPRITMEIGSIEVIKKLVQLDLGVSIVPLIAIGDELKQKTLAARGVFKHRDCRKLGVIYPAKRLLSPAACEFIRMLKENLAASR